MTDLGRLQKIELRTVWTSEAGDFTPWLAREDNLALLADTIGLDLELNATEKNVGPFRADIVCKNTIDDSWVLIENQLERTDHNHLGQLLTYAAGLNAVTIVWVAAHFTEEHRAALDWLNEVTDASANFFGLEIELWRIGTSEIAPKFNIISQPNDWIKTVSASKQPGSGEMSETQQLQLEFWQAFRDYLEENGSFLKSQKPLPQNWTSFAIGRSGFNLGASVNTRTNQVNVNLYIGGNDARAYFYLLAEEKDQIEADIGHTLEWRESNTGRSCIVEIYNASFDPENRASWPAQHAWLKEILEAYHRAFSGRVRALNADDYVPEEEHTIDDVLSQ